MTVVEPRGSRSPDSGLAAAAGMLRRALDVLVVEDEALIAMEIEARVEDAGHRIVGRATTVDEAVAAAERDRPDVVIMDLRLADGSWGGDAARAILTRFGARAIFVSGNLDPGVRAVLRELDPVAMLDKPFLDGALEEALAAAVEGRT